MTGVANWRRIEQQLFGQLPFIHVPRRWPEFRPDESVQLVLGQRVPELRLQRLEDGRCLEWPRHLLRLPHPLNNRNFALTFSFFSLVFALRPLIHLHPLIITSTTSVTTSTIAFVLFCLDEACLYQPKEEEEEEEAAEEQETVQLSVGATAAREGIQHHHQQQLPNINKKDDSNQGK